MADTTTVKFDDGAGGDITIPGPVPGSGVLVDKRQAVGLTAGGTRFAYDKGVTTYEVELEFTTLSTADKEALDTFFRTTVGGVTTTWEYTDTGGQTYTARFLNTRLEFDKVAQNVWAVTVRLELSETAK